MFLYTKEPEIPFNTKISLKFFRPKKSIKVIHCPLAVSKR